MAKLRLDLDFEKGKARIGRMKTPHSEFETPVFMPVGTQATVKSVLPADVLETGSSIILSNAYHLYLRPGPEVIHRAGGLHSFMNWPGSILTDSGGFQIMSLGHSVSITDEAAVFRSHIDGSPIRFSPEDAVRAQVAFGADIIMCLDQCIEYPATYAQAKEATERTILWAERSKKEKVPDCQSLFAIVQGSVFPELRRYCCLELSSLDFPGYGIGGLSVGESKEQFYEVLNYTTEYLPSDKPRYLMGVGHPVDIIEGVLAGVDMFDCVLPTRNARHGIAFTMDGSLNLRNARFSQDFLPIEEGCDCMTCQGFSRSYVRHLLIARESLAWTLISIHNLRFFQRFMEIVRRRLADGTLLNFRHHIAQVYSG